MRRRRDWFGTAVLGALSALAATSCEHPAAPEEDPPTEVTVEVGAVTRATLRAIVDAYGTVEPEPAGGGRPAGAAALSAQGPGIVLEVPVREGERVEPGTVVVRLDDRIAAAEVDRAQSALDLARQALDRQEKLDASGNTSLKAMEAARQAFSAARADLAGAEGQLALLRLASPLAGVVARVEVQPGQAVNAGDVVAEIVDPQRLVVTAKVPAAEAARIATGQAVEVSPEGTREPVQEGEVAFVSPQVDPSTATTLVRISLPPDSALRPGRFVRARIVTEERRDRLTVPVESVYTDHEGKSWLSIVRGDTAIRKAVEVGLTDGGLVEVSGQGLDEGTKVVTVGSYALPEETRIRVPKEARAAR